ncbi:MAG: MgtC/SapB family protein [Solobacterium sp.]|nr:MgtC/SapB family protein [Solobacterium sp.]
MLKLFDPIRDFNTLSVVIRLVMAFTAGTVIGLERSYKNKAAGFRTHTLVCLGASIASMVGIYLYVVMRLPADMSRIGAGVVTGLGFIGAGTIVVTSKKEVKGLTTAAGLWTTGMIGLAVGAGFYEGALIGVILVLLVETVFNDIRGSIKKAPEFGIAISYYNRHQLDDVIRFCKDRTLYVRNLQITGHTNDADPVYSALILLRGGTEEDQKETIRQIREMEGVISAELV